MSLVGLGNKHFKLAIYIQNRPPLAEYEQLSHLQPMVTGEIASIAQQTGNHWRKIFNVYAKLAFELDSLQWNTWQQLRDHYLLQADSQQALLFCPPDFSNIKTKNRIHLIAGRTYAQTLDLPSMTWLNEQFAINEEARCVITPYLDYRQLSNSRITFLVSLIKDWMD
ncbi:hypothetical protein [Pleionea sp. CnH1-48]|uniref:DUF6942 family protein n=1 Tax=Pleionea sp. CnH1-48 TaxID=2954494 RepID=UPI0020980211|nr:hypothetical protein [Pleionea sp. CnH1-48]MCO7223537.1 hypothetical protein [Pleionea sp. CnH1-48]